MLEHETLGTGRNGAPSVRGVAMHRQEYHTHVGHLGAKLHQRFDSVEPRHRDVGDDHVGPKPLGGLDQRNAVLDDLHQIELLGEKAPQSFDEHPMVVGKQNARPSSHVAFPRNGTHATIMVPDPGALRIWRSPPSWRTRSRMLACPRLGRSRGPITSKPTPSSTTVSSSPARRGASETLTAVALA